AMDSRATAAPAGVPAPASIAAPSAEHDAVKTPDTPVAPPEGYYLQVGAFRAADSAARFRTRLEALQLPASIEAIELANRETWHRVRIGPYKEVAATEAVRSRLKSQGIDSLLVKPAE
ncbi:MAG: SPOR domain-containing protein, partial [Gammaproteobacteria bacterium]